MSDITLDAPCLFALKGQVALVTGAGSGRAAGPSVGQRPAPPWAGKLIVGAASLGA